MYRISFRTLLILSAVSMAAPGRAADPADPQAAVPPLHYRSIFLTPGAASPTAVGDWRAVNAAVGQQSGHAHGQASADDPHAGHRSTPPVPDSGGHAGHGHAMPGHDMQGHEKKGHSMHGHAMHDHDTQGQAMPEHCMPASGQPDEKGGHGGMHPDQPKESGHEHRH